MSWGLSPHMIHCQKVLAILGGYVVARGWKEVLVEIRRPITVY